VLIHKRFTRRAAVGVVFGGVAAFGGLVQAAKPVQSAAQGMPQWLGLGGPAPDLAAKFSVTSTGAAGVHRWYFFRSAQRIAVLKGDIDEAWLRDAQGRISFERVFHTERQAVDYSTGELATLGVQADWQALATLVDARELATLKLVSRSGSGAAQTLRLQGLRAGTRLRVDWLPALQLPSRIDRQNKAGRTHIELLQHATAAPSDWPQPGQRSADYLHFDAADFGDMDYQPVVRKSEAMDIRAGWRVAHKHD
jgi:hypothetical protein